MADVKTERLSRQLKAQAESILEKSGVELAQGSAWPRRRRIPDSWRPLTRIC